MSDDSALSVPEKTRGKEKKKKGEKHTSKRVGEGGGGGGGCGQPTPREIHNSIVFIGHEHGGGGSGQQQQPGSWEGSKNKRGTAGTSLYSTGQFLQY